MSEAISEAFMEIVELAGRLGVSRIDKIPGCWEVDVDGRWWVAVNGHREPTKCSRASTPLEPFEAYVEFNGWPAGGLTPAGGWIAAGGVANEDTFIEALKAAGRTGQGRDGDPGSAAPEQANQPDSQTNPADSEGAGKGI